MTQPKHPVVQRHIWINADRVFYAGLIGQRSNRVMGSIQLYVSLSEPIRISIDDGEWITTSMAVVQPYTPHRIACDNHLVAVIHIEPETVLASALPDFLTAQGPLDDGVVIAQVRAAYLRINSLCGITEPTTADFDRFLLGRSLTGRTFDARIATLLDSIKNNPCGQASAADCAAGAGMSVSGFLHLFRKHVGSTFRSFRSWKRGRSLLYRLIDPTNLVYLALNAGYPDSTHFSHSVRQLFGMTPTLLFKNHKHLRMHGHAAPPPNAL